ncbi:GAP family protein [Humibacter ginsenosidimutans]|uniref:GAP family protein n=1 Tax=Humibacter ginsenosidimutans TaxID=2599293 RepID=A0A5B8M0R7_9MICO|nr:GAP family protein [Humibacter ginsenosidimutans]QDZ14267.1 GAP family protein [Humibacter ginsenosidimutans]
MGPLIGTTLPLAVGIAISPVPIIAAILMLLSPRAKSTGVGFMVGWVVGIAVAVIIFTALSSILPASDPDATRPIVGIIDIVLGVLLLLIALRQWRGRPRAGEEPKLPGWMKAIDSMTAMRGLVLGLLLSAVNPKNLLLAVSAGLAIGSAGASLGTMVVVIVVFVLVAACSVVVPVIAYLVASDAMRGPLGALRGWLSANNAVIMAVLMLVIGVVVIGKGIGQF